MLDILASLGEFLGGLAVIGGVVYAVIQVRQFRAAKEREISLELLHSFQTPDFVQALLAVYDMPEGLDSKDKIVAHLGDKLHLVYAMMTTWESLGVLVFRGELSLDLVDDFFSGPITISWRKLEPYIRDERKEQHRETIEEWFEWLNGRLCERESNGPPIPAHIAHKDWKPNDA